MLIEPNLWDGNGEGLTSFFQLNTKYGLTILLIPMNQTNHYYTKGCRLLPVSLKHFNSLL